MSKSRPVKAIIEYREAIRLNKDHASAHYCLGIALSDQGRLDEAIEEYRMAIRLKKDFAEAHCNLGYQLQHWQYPSSAQWVRKAERLVQLDAKLPEILTGHKQPADNAERLALARICQMPCKKQYLATTCCYREAFAEKPQLADDLNAQHRYNAACAAALAGCGQGKDADKLDTKERARLHQQALDWLRADLKAYWQMIEKSADKAGPEIAQRMQHWLKDEDFAGVRGDKALAKLPEAERSAWEKLWADVAEMLAKAQRKAPAQKKPETK